MKRFLKKLALFALLFLLSAAGLVLADFLIIGPQNLGNYQAALLDKTAALHAVSEPKILLLGNSNVAFGFDSQRIADAMGMPVINMGLHGGLGSPFHENMVKLGLNPGDIAVFCPNDFGDEDTISTPQLAWITIETHLEFWKLIPVKAYPDMLHAYPNYLYSSAVRKLLGSRWNVPEDNTPYSRSAFNALGDIDYRPGESYTIQPGDIVLPEVSEACLDRLNRLNQYVLSQGATLVIAGYPIADGEFTPPIEDFVAIENQVREALDCPFISHYADYRFSYDQFYNSYLHLSWEGAQARSDQLIRDLKAWMAE